MFADRTTVAQCDVSAARASGGGACSAPRDASCCRQVIRWCIGFALTLLVLTGALPAAGVTTPLATACRYGCDRDGNGVEDVLDQWREGTVTWAHLRQFSHSNSQPRTPFAAAAQNPVLLGQTLPTSGVIGAGLLRLVCLGVQAGDVAAARAFAERSGVCRVLHDLPDFGGVTVLAVDQPGLRSFLGAVTGCRVMLDRDGTPALLASRVLVGADRVTAGPLWLGDDWSATVAILDSGLDSAHGDLGDLPDDDRDGPPPQVGDASDWSDAAAGWPLFAGYKVVGWHDVTDDFPASQGPWDYHYHGTALASVVAGTGAVDPNYRGMSPGTRLTVVKFYDFDLTWHAWAGDFLAACAWTLNQRDVYRVRTALVAVNWDVDVGISAAMDAFVAAGILPVVAMGNSGDSPAGPGYPAALPNVLTVGAVNNGGAVSAYSTRGIRGAAKPDLVAPGGGLLPANGRIVAADIEPNDSYSGRVGTSLAAAHVAGAAALLDEVLGENGLAGPRGAQDVAVRQAVLRYAVAVVDRAETPNGLASVDLTAATDYDRARGYGLLRVDAAVQALTMPLWPGQSQRDTLSGDPQRPVAARRLLTAPGVPYTVIVSPSPGLDLCMTVVTVSANGETVVRGNRVGAGAAEEVSFVASAVGWSFLVVHQLAGAGEVTLNFVEDGIFPAQGSGQTLPGVVTGAPNVGELAPFPGRSLIVPSRVTIDPGAYSLNVLDLNGGFRPGWPVFVFPGAGAQGGLTQPMAVNLDGVPGDEIVAASGFGSLYFFTGSGTSQTVNLAFNRALTLPVGFQTAVGGWRVLVVDELGWVRSWSWNAAVGSPPELMHEVFLGHSHPLEPAVGRLTVGGPTSLVVSFADGWVFVLDENLVVRPGWPRSVASSLSVAPVLCDLGGSGYHEIVIPVFDQTSGHLAMRVLGASGDPAPRDGTMIPPMAGGAGRWLQVSQAVVSGRYDTGTLNVGVAGLVANGVPGAGAAWTLDFGRIYGSGAAAVEILAGFQLGATTDQGVLVVDQLLLPTPLAWNQIGTPATEPGVLFSLAWHELLYGFTSLPGATTGWLLAGTATDPLVRKQPLSRGGHAEPGRTFVGSLLVETGSGVDLRVDTVDDHLDVLPVVHGQPGAVAWGARRSDSQNSGAYPLKADLSVVSGHSPAWRGLRVFPNPGGSRLEFRAASGLLPATAKLDIFDVRGYRVASVHGVDSRGVMVWNGVGNTGARLAEGTYLAVASIPNSSEKFRVALRLHH